MSTDACRRYRREIEAFIDGELAYDARAVMSAHLLECASCAAESDAHRQTGERLRTAAQQRPATDDLGGLAGGVLSRLQAEGAQSWKARIERAVEDWHWLLIGSGSVAATCVVTLFVSAVLVAGPAPERKDSLAGLIDNLGSSAGTLLVVGTPVGDDRNSMLMEVVDGYSTSVNPGQMVAPAELGFASEGDLVRALAETVTRDGRLVELGEMPKAHRDYTEALLGDIRNMRQGGRMNSSTGAVTVLQVVLRANASVSAKGL